MTGREAEDQDEAIELAVTGVDSSGVVSSGASDLELYRSGSLDRDAYIERQVERVTAHLVGQVEAGRLETMRQLLRSQLAEDPYLSGLVAAAGR